MWSFPGGYFDSPQGNIYVGKTQYRRKIKVGRPWWLLEFVQFLRSLNNLPGGGAIQWWSPKKRWKPARHEFVFLSGCFAPVPIPVRVTAVRLFSWLALWFASSSQMQAHSLHHVFILSSLSKEAPPPPPVPLHCSLDLPEPENCWPTIHAEDALKDRL